MKKLEINLINLTLIIPIILFGIYVSRHAIDMPFMDDMELVKTINDVREDPASMFSVLVRQQNDHRITFARLGIVAACLITGNIDFRVTILLGYFNLLLLCFGFYLMLRSQHRRGLYFLPVVLLLFSPFIYQVHLWSITSFQYPLSVALSIICLYFLQPENARNWLYSLPFAAAATLANLDGLSVLPIGIFWLLCQARRKEAVIFSGFALCYLVFFFRDFKLSSASHLVFSMDSVSKVGLSLLAITGSFAKIISDTYSVKLSVIFGAVILIIFTSIKVFPSLKTRSINGFAARFFTFDFTEICFLRLLASMVMIAVGRHWDGIDNMMAARFSGYAVSMVIVLYLLLLKLFKEKPGRFFRAFAIVVTGVLCVFNYQKYDPDVDYLVSKLKADNYNYAHNRVYFYQYLNLPDPVPDFYRNYKFPVLLKQEITRQWANETRRIDKGTDAIVTANGVPNARQYNTFITSVVEFDVQTAHLKLPRNEIYMSIRPNESPARLYFVALRERNGGWIRRILQEQPTRTFFGAIPKKIASGIYTAKLCWLENGKPAARLISTNVFID